MYSMSNNLLKLKNTGTTGPPTGGATSERIRMETTTMTTTTNTTTNYSALRQAGLLLGTIKAAAAKHEARVAARALPPLKKSHTRMIDARVRVQLSSSDMAQSIVCARTDYPRRQNWLTPKPSTTRKTTGYGIQDIDNGKYSSRCTYTHWTYQPWVTSYAWLTYAGKSIGWRIWAETGTTKAPRGYRWERDANGVKLVSVADPRNDYHPDSEDLRTLSPRQLAAKLRANAATRRAADKLARAEAAKTKKQQAEDRSAMRRAEQEGAEICLADSIRAGNCQAGTKNFADRHGLDISKHYRPTQILKIANGEAHRVRLAVAVGLRRHRHEMDQGFCVIADHRA